MMIIDIRKLISQSKYSGECHFSYDPPARLDSVPLTEFSGEARIDVSFWILEDDSVEIKGKVTYSLKGKCSRCLKDTASEFEGEINAYFVPEGKKKYDEDDYTYKNEVVDLTECVDDTIIFSMPYVLLCDESCSGIAYRS